MVFLKGQGSVLGPLHFVMYMYTTTPLSTLISSLSLNYHLCADDSQLFSHSILVTLTQVSPTSRPLCNRFSPPQIFLLLILVRLNFSLLVSNGNFLKQTTLHSIPLILHAALVLSDEHLTFSDQISSLSKSCYSHTRELPLYPSLP